MRKGGRSVKVEGCLPEYHDVERRIILSGLCAIYIRRKKIGKV